MKTEVVLNALAIILFLGFGTACVIAFTTLDKQKEITIPSRYGRQVGPLEILYVNLALVMVAVMLYFKNYRFLPAIIVFVLFIFFNSRMSSGISPGGVFIGFNYLEWNKIAGYRIINDKISTVQIRVYANKKQYVIRCDKDMRRDAEHLFIENGIKLLREENNEAFN
ncbi:MAG: hypothetical protein K6G76_05165 [Lachnospiraceae bacterium]|nr:hypothetical protein [Lachnospiraceae bacterium]